MTEKKTYAAGNIISKARVVNLKHLPINIHLILLLQFSEDNYVTEIKSYIATASRI